MLSELTLASSQPWVDEASTLVHAAYGGNALGSGLADVLFGKRDFSGKLSLSFPCVTLHVAPLDASTELT